MRWLRRLTSEERANVVTHGAGALLAFLGAAVLIVRAASRGDARHAAAVGVYGLALLGVYATSTLYHAATDERLKRRARVLDRACVSLLIAGTYTPFLLSAASDGPRLALLGAVWMLGLAGVAWKILGPRRARRTAVAVDVAAAWLPVPVLAPYAAALPPAAVGLLLAGGVCYSIGMGFYLAARRVAYGHTVWHVFVLAGSALHYASVLRLAAR
jgi:hemolysin III